MSLTAVYRLFGFDTETANKFYNQLESASLDTGAEDFTVTPSGHTLPMFTAVGRQRPYLPFATHQVATALGEFGLLGVDPGNVILRFRKFANRATRVADATSGHITFTCNSVLAHLNQITAGAHKAAIAQGRFVLLNDGSNAAYIYSGSATHSETVDASENFILGKIGHGGTEISGCDNFSMELGTKLIEPDEEILSEPTFAAIEGIQPTLMFDTLDAAAWSLHRTAVTNGLKVNLVKRKPNLDRYADGDSEHINFLVDAGRILCESIGQKGVTRVKVFTVSSDGSASPVTATVDTTVDITSTGA